MPIGKTQDFAFYTFPAYAVVFGYYFAVGWVYSAQKAYWLLRNQGFGFAIAFYDSSSFQNCW
jgi:hypothetical protein